MNRLIPPLILGAIAYFMIGLVPEASNFMRFEFTLVLFNLVAAALCLCIGAIFSSAAVANLLASLTMLFSMLFAGFLLNKGNLFKILMKENIPVVLRWAQYLSFFNYAFEALIVNEMRELQLRDKEILDLKVLLLKYRLTIRFREQ